MSALPGVSRASLDRPPGVPAKVIAPFLSFYALFGVIVPCTIILAGEILHTAGDPLLDNFYAFLLIAAAFLLPILFGLRAGKLWAIRVFRLAAIVLAGLTLMDLAAAIMTAAGLLGPDVRANRETASLFATLFLLCGLPIFILFRGLGRIRWLDPNAPPAEWERPARQPKGP